MASSTDLEDLYPKLIIAEKEKDGVVIGGEEEIQSKQIFVLVGRFFNEKTSFFRLCRIYWRHYGDQKV